MATSADFHPNPMNQPLMYLRKFRASPGSRTALSPPMYARLPFDLYLNSAASSGRPVTHHSTLSKCSMRKAAASSNIAAPQ